MNRHPARATSLEQSIATALSSDIASADLAALIAEVEAAIDAAGQAVETERTKALDPLLSPDPTKARAAMHDAAFTRDRLRTLLPRLQARYEQVTAEEYLVQWHSDYEALKVRRDALVEELREVYPAAVAQLIGLFDRIAINDNELSRLHQARPGGVHLHLLEVEMEARGVDHFGLYDLRIPRDIKLPTFEVGPRLAWPLPTMPLSLQIVGSMSLPAPAATPEQIAARNAAQQGEGERIIAYYKERDRQREEREAYEGREAIARGGRTPGRMGIVGSRAGRLPCPPRPRGPGAVRAGLRGYQHLRHR
jgi:hypothetical protein